jgi:DHA1 family tetracycline resistance protein-like MFS transporter
MSAVMGIGLIAGPMLGGLLGSISLRAPYLLAAVLNAINAAFVLFLLPETRIGAPARLRISPRTVLPSFAIFRAHPGVPRLVGLYALMFVAAQVPMALWILYCQNRYGWDERVVGLSLAVYGLLHAGAQWFLIAPLTRRVGERGSVVIGVLSDATAYTILGLSSQGWVAFALMPLFCLGGVAFPAIQSLLSHDVPAEQQGRLQGALVSLGSLIGIPGPILVTAGYAHSPTALPGLVWLLAAGAYLLTAILLTRRPPRRLTAPQGT